MTRILKHKIELKDLSKYKIGGVVEYLLDFASVDQLKQGLFEWQEITQKKKIDLSKIFIMGEGTNILFNDKQLDGLILKNSIKYIKQIGLTLEIGAGTTVSQLNNYCIDNSLSGTEWSGGLPGSFGGAIFGNAGAFGGETQDNIISITSVEIETLQLITRTKERCCFDYRNSIYKKLGNKEIILFAIIKLNKGDKTEIEKRINENIKYRTDRQPLEYPSIGSTFKNLDINKASTKLIEMCRDHIKNDPMPVIPAAYLISLSGLKGKKVGDAQISEKHPNFIINLGKAKSSDVKSLIDLVQKELKSQFGVSLETEVIVQK